VLDVLGRTMRFSG
jgi:hypothetical protein